ncbi:MAG: hypothetical protein K9J06_04190 [Flavobacteriales bacterium]|nr:hypothetical protein [Flavobacteriales bacterium]
MEIVWTAFFLVVGLTPLEHTCDTINGREINCVDENGLNQGYWEHTRKKVLVSWHGGHGSEEGCQYGEHSIYELVSCGHYRDGKKIGTWKYYSDWIKEDGKSVIIKEITYNSDGSVVEDRRSRENYWLQINKDSTEIHGYYLHPLDTINFECKDDTCVFLIAGKVTLAKFPLEDFSVVEDRLFRLQMRIDDREIRMKRSN